VENNGGSERHFIAEREKEHHFVSSFPGLARFNFFNVLICIVRGGGWNQGPLDTAAT
jgi:hypothetical protein